MSADTEATSEGRSTRGSDVVPSGGVGAEKTPASSDTPGNTSVSAVRTTGAVF